MNYICDISILVIMSTGPAICAGLIEKVLKKASKKGIYQHLIERK